MEKSRWSYHLLCKMKTVHSTIVSKVYFVILQVLDCNSLTTTALTYRTAETGLHEYTWIYMNTDPESISVHVTDKTEGLWTGCDSLTHIMTFRFLLLCRFRFKMHINCDALICYNFKTQCVEVYTCAHCGRSVWIMEQLKAASSHDNASATAVQ